MRGYFTCAACGANAWYEGIINLRGIERQGPSRAKNIIEEALDYCAREAYGEIYGVVEAEHRAARTRETLN